MQFLGESFQKTDMLNKFSWLPGNLYSNTVSSISAKCILTLERLVWNCYYIESKVSWSGGKSSKNLMFI